MLGFSLEKGDLTPSLCQRVHVQVEENIVFREFDPIYFCSVVNIVFREFDHWLNLLVEPY